MAVKGCQNSHQKRCRKKYEGGEVELGFRGWEYWHGTFVLEGVGIG